jgi:hypothetical protein
MLTRKHLNNIPKYDVRVPDNAGFLSGTNFLNMEKKIARLRGNPVDRVKLHDAMKTFMSGFFDNVEVGSISWKDLLDYMNESFLKKHGLYCANESEQHEINVFKVAKYHNMTADDYRNLNLWAPVNTYIDNNRMRNKNRIPEWQLIGHKRFYDTSDSGSLRHEHREQVVSGYRSDAMQALLRN